MAFGGSESGTFIATSSSPSPFAQAASTCTGGCNCSKSPTTSIFATQPQASSLFTVPQTTPTNGFGPSKFPTPDDPQNMKTLSDKGPQATPSSFSFMPRERAAFSDVPTRKDGVPLFNEDKSAHCDASRPIQSQTSSTAAANGHSLVNLLTSALFTQNSPFVIGFAGQFPPDTLVLCQLPTSTSLTQTSTPTAFTCPEKAQNAPENAVRTDKISGQPTEGALKLENSSSWSSVRFGCPPPTSEPGISAFGTARF